MRRFDILKQKRNCSLRILKNQEFLIPTIVNELSHINKNTLSESFIILPTQRLAHYLKLFARQFGIRLRDNQVLNLEAFLRRETLNFQYFDKAVSPFVEELILSSILESENFDYLNVGCEHEVIELFSQFTSRSLGSEIFERLADHIQKNIYREDVPIGSLVDRIKDLKRLHQIYHRTLDSKSFVSGEKALQNAVLHCVNSWQTDVPWENLIIAGFTTIKESFVPLFKLFKQKESVKVILNAPPLLSSSHSPLRDLCEIFEGDCDSFSIKEELSFVKVTELESKILEVCYTIDLVKDYISKGVSPQQIGVLVSDEASYQMGLEFFFKKAGIRVNQAISTSYANTPSGSILKTLVDSILSYDPKSYLNKIIRHPIFNNNSYAQNSSNFSLYGDPSNKLSGEKILTSIEAIRLNKLATASEFYKSFEELVPNEILAYINSDKCSTSEKLAYESFFNLFAQWSNIWSEKISVKSCFKRLCERLVSLEVREIGFPDKGVQILNLIESRNLPLDVIIVLGCVEDSFPKALPKDYLVDDRLKQAIGLPGWAYIEALEETTFYLMCRQAKRKHLLYSLDKTENQTRSRFVEKTLMSDGVFFEKRSVWPKSIAALGSSIEFKKMSISKGVYVGERSALFDPISASSLSDLFSCPYKFLLQRLGVRKVKDDDNEALKEGQLLHQILDSFVSGLVNKHRVLPHLNSLPSDARNIMRLTERVIKITKSVLPYNMLNSPFHLHLNKYSWPKFVKHWFNLRDLFKEDKIDHQEYSIRHSKLNWPFSDKESVSLLGTIDDIIKGSNLTVITDYKRKRASSSSEVESGISPQLALYALALNTHPDFEIKTEAQNIVLGYWSILEGIWLPRGVGSEVRKTALKYKLANARTSSAEKLIEALQNIWASHIVQLVDQDKDFEPINCQFCSFCDYKRICKIQDSTSCAKEYL